MEAAMLAMMRLGVATSLEYCCFSAFCRDRKGTPKNFCDRDFTELLGELSGAICLKTLVLFGSALELFRKIFGAVRAMFLLWRSFWLLILCIKTSHTSKHHVRTKERGFLESAETPSATTPFFDVVPKHVLFARGYS